MHSSCLAASGSLPKLDRSACINNMGPSRLFPISTGSKYWLGNTHYTPSLSFLDLLRIWILFKKWYNMQEYAWKNQLKENNDSSSTRLYLRLTIDIARCSILTRLCAARSICTMPHITVNIPDKFFSLQQCGGNHLVIASCSKILQRSFRCKHTQNDGWWQTVSFIRARKTINTTKQKSFRQRPQPSSAW